MHIATVPNSAAQEPKRLERRVGVQLWVTPPARDQARASLVLASAKVNTGRLSAVPRRMRQLCAVLGAVVVAVMVVVALSLKETTNTVVVYYNKRMFADNGLQPPETWDDLKKIAGVFNGKGIAPVVTPAGQDLSRITWRSAAS